MPPAHEEPTRPRRRIAARLAAVLLGLLVAVALLEVGLRRVEPPAREWAIWRPGLERVFHPDPARMPGVEGTSRFSVDSLGLRGDEPPEGDALRVLCLGGSTTECLYLDQAEAWPQLVQELLAGRTGRTVWVGNGGRSGHSTREHVLQARHLLPRLAELDLLVLMVGVNDLGLRLARDERYVARGLDDSRTEARVLRKAFQVRPIDGPRPLLERTAIGRAARRLVVRRQGAGQAQDEVGAVYETWREHRRGAAAWRDELPELEGALEEYRRNLREIVGLARAAGVRTLLITQPSLWRDDLPPELDALLWMGGVGDYQSEPGAEYYTARALARGLARYDLALVELAAELDVDVLDLAGELTRDASVFYDDVHFGERGAREVAERVAERLLELGG